MLLRITSILCNNRDEWMTRPTEPVHWHSFNHHEATVSSSQAASSEGDVLSGIDIIAGGTWFGINKSGKVALLYVGLINLRSFLPKINGVVQERILQSLLPI